MRGVTFLNRQGDVGIPQNVKEHAGRAGLAGHLVDNEKLDDFWTAAAGAGHS